MKFWNLRALTLNGLKRTKYCHPGKFLSIIIDKKKQDDTKKPFKIGDKVIEASPSVKLLVVQLDDKINFNLKITNICGYAANQLNSFIRLKQFLSFKLRRY